MFAIWSKVKVTLFSHEDCEDYWLALVNILFNISKKVSIHLEKQSLRTNQAKRIDALDRMLHCTESFTVRSWSSQQPCETGLFLNHSSKWRHWGKEKGVGWWDQQIQCYWGGLHGPQKCTAPHLQIRILLRWGHVSYSMTPIITERVSSC